MSLNLNPILIKTQQSAKISGHSMSRLSLSLRIAHEHPWVQSAVHWDGEPHYWSSVETLAAWLNPSRTGL